MIEAINERYDSGDDYGPNECGLYTSGIAVGNHGNAIEFFAKTQDEASARRDLVLSLIHAEQDRQGIRHD